MPRIKIQAFLIPRNTSAVVTAPPYEKPLLQAKHNTGVGDRAMHIQSIDWPKSLPASGQVSERELEAEMQRLAVYYGLEIFHKFYPVEEMFTRAFEASQAEALPQDTNPIPDATVTPEGLVEEFLELRVPSLGKAQAQKFVDAGLMPELLLNADAKALATVVGLPLNLIRSTIEAAKARPAFATSGAPSAPSQFKPTKMEAPGLT